MCLVSVMFEFFLFRDTELRKKQKNNEQLFSQIPYYRKGKNKHYSFCGQMFLQDGSLFQRAFCNLAILRTIDLFSTSSFYIRLNFQISASDIEQSAFMEDGISSCN